MRFDAVETTAVGNLFLAAVSTAPFFRMVNSSPGALGTDAIEEVGRLIHFSRSAPDNQAES
jgi:hypothetical protein